MYFIQFIFYLIIMGIYIGLLVWKLPTNEEQSKYYYYGIISFYTLWILGRVFYQVVEQLTKGTFEYNLYYALFNFSGYLGATLFIFVIERYVYNKLKYIPTMVATLATIGSVVIFQFYGTSLTIILTVIGAASMVFIPIIYYKVAYETDGKTRIKALILGSSQVIWMFGVLFNTNIFYSLIPIMYFIAPLIQLFSAGFYIYAFLFYKTSYN